MFDLYQDHFGEDVIDQVELEELIIQKRKNKLYELFLKENKLPSVTSKRKHSPEEVVSTKLRRMTLASDSSPRLRKTTVAARRRTESTGSNRSNKKNQKALDPQQQLLSTLWGKKKNL